MQSTIRRDQLVRGQGVKYPISILAKLARDWNPSFSVGQRLVDTAQGVDGQLGTQSVADSNDPNWLVGPDPPGLLFLDDDLVVIGPSPTKASTYPSSLIHRFEPSSSQIVLDRVGQVQGQLGSTSVLDSNDPVFAVASYAWVFTSDDFITFSVALSKR